MLLKYGVAEDSSESCLDCKEIKPVNPKGNQSWIFTGRTDAEAEGWILWSPDAKSQLIGKNSFAGQDGTGGEGGNRGGMVGWHYRLNGHEFDQTLGDGEGKGSLAAAVHGVSKTQTRLSDWTTMKQCCPRNSLD